MTLQDAFRIIQECRNWNEGQRSVSLALTGVRTAEDDVLDEKRESLRQAWQTVRQDHELRIPSSASESK